MKVAFLVPSIVNCGPINVVLNIINSSFTDVSFYVFAINKVNSDYEEKFKIILNGNIFFLENSTTLLKDFEYILLKNSIDVVHSHGFYPDKILSQVKINVRKISTIHCMFYKDYPKEYGYLKGLLGALLHFSYLKRGNFDYIVGCSEAVNNYVSKRVKIGNFNCIRNGVDQNIFYPISKYEKKIRKKAQNICENNNVYIYSGRLIRRKRVPELIDYFQKKYDGNSTLLIIGEGPELNKCKGRVKSDNIIFLGFVSNPEYYYQMSDYVLSFSSAEGYPMSIIEAVSCGCYAILSPILPHIEFIDNTNLGALIGSEKKIIEIDANLQKLSSKNMALAYLSLYENK